MYLNLNRILTLSLLWLLGHHTSAVAKPEHKLNDLKLTGILTWRHFVQGEDEEQPPCSFGRSIYPPLKHWATLLAGFFQLSFSQGGNFSSSSIFPPSCYGLPHLEKFQVRGDYLRSTVLHWHTWTESWGNIYSHTEKCDNRPLTWQIQLLQPTAGTHHFRLRPPLGSASSPPEEGLTWSMWSLW